MKGLGLARLLIVLTGASTFADDLTAYFNESSLVFTSSPSKIDKRMSALPASSTTKEFGCIVLGVYKTSYRFILRKRFNGSQFKLCVHR